MNPEIYPIDLSAIDDPEIEKVVDDRVDQFMRILETQGNQKGQIAVIFHEKRTKKAWFSKSEEEICWEQWPVTINTVICRTENGIDQFLTQTKRIRKDMDDQLATCLLDIIRFVNDKKDHIPPITTSDINPFPFQIVIPDTADTWGTVLKRILTDPSQQI
ncbi:5563_t:CDS:2 [Funneliformis caledonium]|uniref:Autophagy-related protein 101 n=1 Tax=Funneliformis caledonium TaxID=1117310 RepID=A0A9N9G5C5_9GLOM|nr:5563_t:CDS:2 [Funneliformis caledonium]